MSEPYGIFDLPPEKKTFIFPEGGMKRGEVWIVEVATSKNNPIHRSILNVGFMNNEKSFGGYCEVWRNNYDRSIRANDLHYMKAIRKIANSIED